jgi:TetR/AcrR family transcriptional repressor of nem operon
MRRSREEAAQTRRTAVKAASRLYRERGIEAVSIGDIMASLGMTVGGFYRHFDSKDALVAEACARAFADSARAQEAAVGSAAHGRPLSALLGSYLSEAHRDTPATGCPVPSLVSGISRQPVPVRRAFTEGVRSTLRRIERLSPAAEPAARTALLGGMIGALALARAVDEERLSTRLLDQSRAFWTRALSERASRATGTRRRGNHKRKPASPRR